MKCLISCVQRVHALSPSTFYQAPLSSCTAEVNQILQHAATPERVPEVVALSHRKPPPPLLNGKYRKQPQGAQGASAPDTEPTEIICCYNNWVLSGMRCVLIQDQMKHCNRYADMSGLSLWKQGWQLAVDAELLSHSKCYLRGQRRNICDHTGSEKLIFLGSF